MLELGLRTKVKRNLSGVRDSIAIAIDIEPG